MKVMNQLQAIIIKNPSSKTDLMRIYRYISLLVTSCFFLVGQPHSSFMFKVGLVLSLGVVAWIVEDLQRRNIQNHRKLMVMVLTEIIGLTLVLLQTGGIGSPFIWYALTPVLVAASFLSSAFCLGVLAFYLSSATFIAYLNEQNNMLQLLQEYSYIYLVCLLITFLVVLFSKTIKELDLKITVLNQQQEELLSVNNKLAETKKEYQDALEHIMSLYHMLESFSSHTCPDKLLKEITTFLMKCTQTDAAFFGLTDNNSQISCFINATTNEKLENDIKKEWHQIRRKKEIFISVFDDENYCMKIIKTPKNVGVLGVKISNIEEVKNSYLLKRTFEFFAELCEMMLDRIHVHQMMEQMIIIEEQNRIANEIHDSVSQRLFGIVYSLHSLRVKSRNISSEELEQEYQFLSQTANTTMKELRASIYKLSSVKKGDKPFLVILENYLSEFAKLYDITIDFQVIGDESYLSPSLKNGLYRIICEASGNAVRHGHCTEIDLTIAILEEKIIVEIQDNGIGYSKNDNRLKGKDGIGISNMQNIVHSLAGTFEIDGIKGLGTSIQIHIPIVNMIKKQEVLG